jgi:hypothetical protein
MMCQEKVTACASLYSKGVACKINESSGKIDNAQECGVATLLAFVDTVDDVKVSMLCKGELENYAKELCTPEGGRTKEDFEKECVPADQSAAACSPKELNDYIDSKGLDISRGLYPYRCRSLPFKGEGSVYELLVKRAYVACVNPDTGEFDESGKQVIADLTADISERLRNVLMRECLEVDGPYKGSTLWFAGASSAQVVAEWAVGVFGTLEKYAATMPNGMEIILGEAGLSGTTTVKGGVKNTDITKIGSSALGKAGENIMANEDRTAQGWGVCIPATTSILCTRINEISKPKEVASYNEASRTCSMTAEYYPTLCGLLPGGTWNENTKICTYIPD